MTTIAYRDGVIAFDSRLSEEDLIISDTYDKSYKEDGLNIFFAGSVVLVPMLVEFIVNSSQIEMPGELEALVWMDNELLWAGLSDGYYYKLPIKLDTCFAIGSGKPHAYTAMDMGADATLAVKMAMRRDKNTGGLINSFRL